VATAVRVKCTLHSLCPRLYIAVVYNLPWWDVILGPHTLQSGMLLLEHYDLQLQLESSNHIFSKEFQPENATVNACADSNVKISFLLKSLWLFNLFTFSCYCDFCYTALCQKMERKNLKVNLKINHMLFVINYDSQKEAHKSVPFNLIMSTFPLTIKHSSVM